MIKPKEIFDATDVIFTRDGDLAVLTFLTTHRAMDLAVDLTPDMLARLRLQIARQPTPADGPSDQPSAAQAAGDP